MVEKSGGWLKKEVSLITFWLGCVKRGLSFLWMCYSFERQACPFRRDVIPDERRGGSRGLQKKTFSAGASRLLPLLSPMSGSSRRAGRYWRVRGHVRGRGRGEC